MTDTVKIIVALGGYIVGGAMTLLYYCSNQYLSNDDDEAAAQMLMLFVAWPGFVMFRAARAVVVLLRNARHVAGSAGRGFKKMRAKNK